MMMTMMTGEADSDDNDFCFACLSCCHSGADKCFRRDGEDVRQHKVSSETTHCQCEGGRVEGHSSQDDGADKWVREETNGITDWGWHRVVEAQEAGQLVKGDSRNLAGENVDQVLDDSAVVAARRRGGGQGLDQGCGGGRRCRCGGNWCRGGRGGVGA